jgi:hypothetical protein
MPHLKLQAPLNGTCPTFKVGHILQISCYTPRKLGRVLNKVTLFTEVVFMSFMAIFIF